MHKHTVIAIVASVFIAAPFAYSAMNIAALESLQLHSPDMQFSLFGMINGGTIEVCNTSLFSANIDRLDITIFYQEDNIGTYSVFSESVPPLSYIMPDGVFRSDSYAKSQYMLLHIDGGVAGTVGSMLNPDQATVVTSIQTSVLGFFPYNTIEEYNVVDFFDMMNTEFSC